MYLALLGESKYGRLTVSVDVLGIPSHGMSTKLLVAKQFFSDRPCRHPN